MNERETWAALHCEQTTVAWGCLDKVEAHVDKESRVFQVFSESLGIGFELGPAET